MHCDRCRRPAAIFQQYSGNRLCDRHFVLDFERRVKRTIRFEGGICNGDHIAVALSGGPSSIALARVLSGILSGRRDTALFAITINEGRMDRIRYARQTAAILGMKWRVDCDSDFSAPAEEKTDLVPILCDMARESGATRLALGSTVEDCAFSIFTSLYSGKIQHRMTSGTNRPVHCPGLTVIQPLSAIPEEEARLYAELTTGAALGSGFSGP